MALCFFISLQHVLLIHRDVEALRGGGLVGVGKNSEK